MKKKVITYGVIAFAILALAIVMAVFSTDKNSVSVMESRETVSLKKAPQSAMFTSEVSPASAIAGLATDPYKLSCEEKPEDDLLIQAPYGAKRTGEHILEIKYSGGVKEFIDEPPYDEFGMGLRWEYCGYNENIKAHLILRRDKEWYTGSLFFDESGEVVKAGFFVVFSPNKLNFLAIHQWAGADGQDWTMYDKSGHKLWNGFSTIDVPRKPTDTYQWEAATIETPSLSDDLQISAHMFCWQSKKNGNVTLKKNEGKREWLPKIEC